jgi:hypothetical protein
MAGVIKKIRISRETLPPTLIVDNNIRKSFEITGVIVTVNSGNPVYEYTTSVDNDLQAGDFVTITEIVDSVAGNTFNLTNAKILTKPTNSTFQIQVSSSTTVTYVSGGYVAKNSGIYIIRYRIVSEDRNRASHWSPQYILSPGSITENPGANIIDNQVSGQSIVVSWQLPKNYKDQEKSELGAFDVYVAWGLTTAGVGAYQYYSTVTGNSATIAIPLNISGNRIYQKYQVAIQNRTYPIRKRVAELTIAETTAKNL